MSRFAPLSAEHECGALFCPFESGWTACVACAYQPRNSPYSMHDIVSVDYLLANVVKHPLVGSRELGVNARKRKCSTDVSFCGELRAGNKNAEVRLIQHAKQANDCVQGFV